MDIKIEINGPKKVGVAAFIFVVIFFVGQSFLQGFIGKPGESLWDRFFSEETAAEPARKVEQPKENARCPYCRVEIPNEYFDLHRKNCPKRP